MQAPTLICEAELPTVVNQPVFDPSVLPPYGALALSHADGSATLYPCTDSELAAYPSTLMTNSDFTDITPHIFLMFAIAIGVRFLRRLFEENASRHS